VNPGYYVLAKLENDYHEDKEQKYLEMETGSKYY